MDKNYLKSKRAVSEQRRGRGVKFERIRRITGYLSFLNQFNDGKKAEERDRVKHQ